jgi:hypothetical protein
MAAPIWNTAAWRLVGVLAAAGAAGLALIRQIWGVGPQMRAGGPWDASLTAGAVGQVGCQGSDRVARDPPRVGVAALCPGSQRCRHASSFIPCDVHSVLLDMATLLACHRGWGGAGSGDPDWDNSSVGSCRSRRQRRLRVSFFFLETSFGSALPFPTPQCWTWFDRRAQVGGVVWCRGDVDDRWD